MDIELVWSSVNATDMVKLSLTFKHSIETKQVHVFHAWKANWFSLDQLFNKDGFTFPE